MRFVNLSSLRNEYNGETRWLFRLVNYLFSSYVFSILKDVEKPKEEEKEEEEYDYESYSDENDDMMIIMNQNETTDTPEENRPIIDESQDGLIVIPNEEKCSAFNIDINRLKIRNWRIIGDESDYFNYGLNESMWKVSSVKYCL